ncbi:hypothetical protein EYW49_18680 [Siculibacillus lacustris]|uniref:HAD family hydrolase n=1 Tax=Siculibacillus lacustris TaxID=1549641 RepID=A0A4Q9VGY4_9HYPH|nr:hypothetical protein [Siculibacillus lacustris]TBW34307.1 hypothetical protein EYW49_18680 [Siculibacillus lacustris]
MSAADSLPAGTATGRPLVVVDVDEVILRFVEPLERYLESTGHRLAPVAFAITGNVLKAGSTRPIPAEAVHDLIEGFYAARVASQPPVDGAVAALARLSAACDIVLLSNLPGRHGEARARRLAELGIAAPLRVNEGPKGPAVAALAAERGAERVIFVDDGPIHLASVRDRVPGARLVQFVDDERFFRMAPEVPGVWLKTRSWDEVAARIEAEARAFAPSG